MSRVVKSGKYLCRKKEVDMIFLVILILLILCISVGDADGIFMWGFPLIMGAIGAFFAINDDMGKEKKGRRRL